MKKEVKKADDKEQQLIADFEDFEDIYAGLLPEMKPPTEGVEPVFKVTINLNEDEDEERPAPSGESQFSEEFSYQQLLSTAITRIDHSSIAHFSQDISNPFVDEYQFFTDSMKEAFFQGKPQLNGIISANSSSLDPVTT